MPRDLAVGSGGAALVESAAGTQRTPKRQSRAESTGEHAHGAGEHTCGGAQGSDPKRGAGGKRGALWSAARPRAAFDRRGPHDPHPNRTRTVREQCSATDASGSPTRGAVPNGPTHRLGRWACRAISQWVPAGRRWWKALRGRSAPKRQSRAESTGEHADGIGEQPCGGAQGSDPKWGAGVASAERSGVRRVPAPLSTGMAHTSRVRTAREQSPPTDPSGAPTRGTVPNGPTHRLGRWACRAISRWVPVGRRWSKALRGRSALQSDCGTIARAQAPPDAQTPGARAPGRSARRARGLPSPGSRPSRAIADRMPSPS